MRTLSYGIKQGLKNIMQNKGYTFAAVGTISICLFMFSIFYALITNFQHMIQNAESSVGITVFFDEGTAQSQIDNIGEDIKACEGVESIKYISADTAWEEFQDDMYSDNEQLADTFGDDNPLKDSASYEVFISDVSMQNDIVNYIGAIDGVRKVNSSGSVAKGLSNFNMLVAYISGSIIVLLLFVSIFLISSTVASGISARKDEISIMKLVGATNIFVSMPFLVEGVVIGVMGSVIPVLVFDILYQRIVLFIINHFTVLTEWLTFVSTGREMRFLAPMSLVVGVGIGFVGSAVSVQRNTNEVIK